MDSDLRDFLDIYAAAKASDDGDRCCVAPSPEIADRMRQALSEALRDVPRAVADSLGLAPETRVGFNDGLNVPGAELPFGAPSRVARNLVLERNQLRGDLRVAVVLVDFPDRPFQDPAALTRRLSDLFFSRGVVGTGSVAEYFEDVSGGAVRITGAVAGPYRMPRTLAAYANGASGTGGAAPNARTLARDAAVAANAQLDFRPYDNDGDGYVEAFIVVHAGRGAEETGAKGDIWSHKWVLEGGAHIADGASIYAYLTIPEDARLGVCAHELGHLLFGFPDLYDTSYASEGVGNWCLMGGGSWLNGGHTPAHPSAWCKCKQGWAAEANITQNGSLALADIKQDRQALRLWRRGAASSEYFLAENRQRTGFDQYLPGGGLLVWRIDETIDGNGNARHPKVALLQADGHADLERAANRGDAGDPFPGAAGITAWDRTTTPGSLSYGGLDTEVGLANIVEAGGIVRLDVTVTRARAAARARRAPPRRAAARPAGNGAGAGAGAE